MNVIIAGPTDGRLMTSPDPRIAEIAALKAENERLKLSIEKVFALVDKAQSKWNKCLDVIALRGVLLEWAWCIIANAGRGNWSTQSEEWQKSAAKFRDDYHAENFGVEMPPPDRCGEAIKGIMSRANVRREEADTEKHGTLTNGEGEDAKTYTVKSWEVAAPADSSRFFNCTAQAAPTASLLVVLTPSGSDGMASARRPNGDMVFAKSANEAIRIALEGEWNSPEAAKAVEDFVMGKPEEAEPESEGDAMMRFFRGE